MANFNSARRQNFPSVGFSGDLWFDTDTRNLYVAVANPNQYFLGLTDPQNVTHIYSEGLTVRRGVQANVPAAGPVGTIYLCTDTLRAFAGTGLGVQFFNFDVTRALRNGDPTLTF